MIGQRKHTPFDLLVMTFDNALRTLSGHYQLTERANPAEPIDEQPLTQPERQLAGRLMRINHAGEVSAQGLYQGQSVTARLPEVREKMARAALEENDHLEWCERRAKELGTHISILSPFWYVGSFGIGALAGLAGDKWSLGFVVETEHQVVRHLDEHLERLSPNDLKSRAILQQMKQDEGHHATLALHAGGAALPLPVRLMMKATSKVMTKAAYWL